MFSKVKIMLAVVLFSLTGMANAAYVWVADQTIEKLHSLPDGNFAIWVDQSTNTNCQANGTLFYVFVNQSGVNSEARKMMLTLATTALVSGKKINISYNNGNNSCFVREIVLKK